uniref:Uncharacterized protein n=1 Tax=Globodera rostochiensis TaxID=31243 RepID=A0A914H7L2_GLORO
MMSADLLSTDGGRNRLKIEKQRGVDVMVARFIKHHIFDAWSLKKRLQRIKPAILETRKLDYYVLLPRLVNELKEIKKLKLFSEWQQSAAIVRQKTAFLVNCVFPTMTVEYRRESTSSRHCPF